MMDEALYVYEVTPKQVRLVRSIPWGQDNFEQTVVRLIAEECGKNPIRIVNDMVEQHYRKERVVTSGVSFLDKKTMVDRKLGMAFPNLQVRASMKLKEKVKSSTNITSDIYIFAAIPSNLQFNKTINVANHSSASFRGFGLLPVETSDMVKLLSKKMQQKNDKTSQWVVMIGQHRNGGLRQVVIKDGEIALTRMTPISDTDEDPKAWSDEVFQEFRSTMSYLTRFGFHNDDGLDIILVSNPEPGDLVRQKISAQYNFKHITPTAAADLLGLKIGEQETQRYSDVLDIAWIAKKRSFIMPMQSKIIDHFAMPRKTAEAASVLLVLSAGFFAYQAFNSFQTIIAKSDDIQNVRSRLTAVNTEYQQELQKKEELGFNIDLIHGSVRLVEEWKTQKLDMMGLFNGIGASLVDGMRIDRLAVERVKQEENTADTYQQNYYDPAMEGQKDVLFETRLQLIYPSNADVEAGNLEVQAFADRLQQTFPDYGVSVSKLLKDYNFVEEITVESGTEKSQEAGQEYVAEILIEEYAAEEYVAND
jgi:hypothetical protein